MAAVSLATRQRLAPIVAVGLVGLVASQGYVDTMPSSDPDPFWLSFTFNVVITVAIMGWGMFIGSRRQVMWTLRQRALRKQAECLRTGRWPGYSEALNELSLPTYAFYGITEDNA